MTVQQNCPSTVPHGAHDWFYLDGEDLSCAGLEPDSRLAAIVDDFEEVPEDLDPDIEVSTSVGWENNDLVLTLRLRGAR